MARLRRVSQSGWLPVVGPGNLLLPNRIRQGANVT